MPSDDELETLRQYEWPGNVRELQNAVERATVLGTGDRLSINLMLPHNLEQKTVDATLHFNGNDFNYKTTMDDFERSFLTELIRASHGNLSEAARMSGIYRANIYRMAKRLNVNLGKGELHG